MLFARDDVNELDTAGRDGGQEDLDRRDLFTGTAVLHWAVDNEVMVARAQKHAAEYVGRARAHLVFAEGGRSGSHGRQPARIRAAAPGQRSGKGDGARGKD